MKRVKEEQKERQLEEYRDILRQREQEKMIEAQKERLELEQLNRKLKQNGKLTGIDELRHFVLSHQQEGSTTVKFKDLK